MRPLDSPTRAPLALLILLLGQLLLMSLHARSQSLNQSFVTSAVLAAYYPFQKAAVFVTSSVKNVWYGYLNLRGVRAENENLKQEIGRLRRELEARNEDALANRRLKDLLALKQSFVSPTLAANVIARDGNLWFRQVTIDQGSVAGVKLNCPVITPQGVVGRVIEVGPASATVQLITDGYAGVGAMLVESRANGELRGRGNASCRLDSITGLVPVREGEAVQTTGLDGYYPKGLLIGYVAQVQLGSGATQHQITVRPSAQLDRLEEVLVLLSRGPEVQITESVKSTDGNPAGTPKTGTPKK